MKISEFYLTNQKLYNTDKFSTHVYENLYDDLFLDKRDDKLNILEIGIYEGGSLKLFHDYFQNASIYGIDRSDCHINKNEVSQFKRINYQIFDAYNKFYNFRLKFGVEGFDIIIDDGPHTIDSQIFAANFFVQYLNDNGILIIEDIFPRNLPDIIANIKHDSSKVQVFDFNHLNTKANNAYQDDILIVLKK